METENALIIFIKNPELGKVKTRIARTTGDAKALDIYFQLSKITRENAILLRGVTCYLFYSDFVDSVDNWSNIIFQKKLQIQGDLGEKMQAAFAEILNLHPRVCIIGSDCPTLSTNILNQAFMGLEKNDFVVGPSTDGGYYLLGMSKYNLENTPNFEEVSPQYLFQKMAWSTENVLPETLKRIREHRKTIYLLPELTDIDEEKDWLAYLKK